MAAAVEEWVPAQYSTQPHIDLRASKTGPKGYKVKGKRKLEELSLLGNGEVPQVDEADAMEQDEKPGADSTTQKRQKANDATYRTVG